LRTLRRRLSPARELEVTVQLLREQLVDEAQDTTVAGTAVLLRLQAGSRRRRRDAARACSGKMVDRIERRLRRAWGVMTGASSPGETWLPDARGRLSRRAADALTAIATGLKSGTEEDLHAARIAFKRWRYGEEWLAGTSQRREDPAWLRSVQASLGSVHDLDELRRRLGDYERKLEAVNPEAGTPLAPLLDRLRTQRHREFERLHERVAPRLAATRSAPTGTSTIRH
jgi:CHAD domain-containing protein